MEHELRIDAEVIRKCETRWIFFPVVREFLAQTDQHSIQPSQDIWRIVDLRLENGDPRHQHRSSLLVERSGDIG